MDNQEINQEWNNDYNYNYDYTNRSKTTPEETTYVIIACAILALSTVGMLLCIYIMIYLSMCCSRRNRERIRRTLPAPLERVYSIPEGCSLHSMPAGFQSSMSSIPQSFLPTAREIPTTSLYSREIVDTSTPQILEYDIILRTL